MLLSIESLLGHRAFGVTVVDPENMELAMIAVGKESKITNTDAMRMIVCKNVEWFVVFIYNRFSVINNRFLQR